ncbi:MAG TPA: hypothetical protein VGC26_09760 [Afipia sp.]
MENSNSTLAIIIAAAAFLMNFVRGIFGGGWNLKSSMAAMEARITTAIAASETKMEESRREDTKAVGETISAIKEHVRQFEFHVRDNYMRKDDFKEMMNQNNEVLKLHLKNIESRLTSIDKQLDAQKP